MRQLKLLEIREELANRNIEPNQLKPDFVDITRLFENSSSKIIRKALSNPEGAVLAVKLPGFKGLLGREIQPGRRFGTELSDYAKVWGGVGGIIHTDELPAYGITSDDVARIYSEIGAEPERDAIVIVADLKYKGEKALLAVVERAKYAFKGVPEETRAANPDGTTRYMRPRPGAARMYPETDIPPIIVTTDLLAKAEKYVPEHPDLKYKKLVELHGLSSSLAQALLNDLRLDFYEYLAEKYGNSVPYTVIASILVNIIPALRREGLPVDEISDEVLEDIVKALSEGIIVKEAIPDVLSYLVKTQGQV
jgi:glutamyl-tRNA(Gln) amidotransferase subunit E (EC 6.3.5.7)